MSYCYKKTPLLLVPFPSSPVMEMNVVSGGEMPFGLQVVPLEYMKKTEQVLCSETMFLLQL